MGNFENRRVPDLIIRDVEILKGGWRNFKGEKSMYNERGDRTFNIIIEDQKVAQQLANDGWAIKLLKPRDEDDPVKSRLEVKINFNFWKPPVINMLCDGVFTKLDEESIAVLDDADILRADVAIRPREWEPGRIKAYLSELIVEIEPLNRSHFMDDWAAEENPGEDDEEAPF